MKTIHTRIGRFALLAAISLLIAPAPILAAQSEPTPVELRQENQRLRDRIAELEAKLAQSQRRADQLQQALRSLRDRSQRDPATDSTATASDADSPKDAGLPDDPFAAPDAMLAHLIKSFNDELGDADADGADNDNDRDGDAEKRRYLVDAQRWARQARLQNRKAVQWIVRLVEPAKKARRRSDVKLVVVDPDTHEAIGDPFSAMLKPRDLAKMRAAPADSLWRLSGLFAARPIVDTHRQGAGASTSQPQIGPRVYFTFTLSVQSIEPAQSPSR